ncbi:Rab-GAP TBC domain-containing protein [Pseudozyma hubeiensis]|nr:Rab-GAP TBC domain-containing protein [Pseudozyma hubeiensis]
MTTSADHGSMAAQAGPSKKHSKTPSRSASLRALPSKLRPKTAPTTPDPGQDPPGATLAPPLPVSPRVRRSSAPEEGSQTPEWLANQFSTPAESDAEFVRRTYAHFAIAGVPDDGFSDGKEYTREKNGLSAWEEAALSRPGSNVAARSASRPAAQLSDSPRIAAANGTGGHAPPPPPLSTSESTRSVMSLASLRPIHQEGNGDVSRPSLPPSTSTETALSTNSFLSTNERRRRQELAEKKRQELIANIDRYGFFSDSPSSIQHKTTLLPSNLFDAPFPKKGSRGVVAQSGSIPASLSGTSTPSHAHGDEKTKASAAVQKARAAADAVHRQREQGRTAKWARMLTVKGRDQGHNAVQYDFTSGTDRKLRRRVYKGIPDRWRSAAWSALLHHSQQTAAGQHSFSFAQPHLRKDSASEAVALDQSDALKFERLTAVPSTHDVQIDLDVPRTISGHIQFHTRYGQGQRALFHVLHAMSMLCDQCGYCQGMGPIAATLLCYFSPERAYAAMVMMHNHLGLHSTFAAGFPGLVENLFVQDQLLRKYMPELASVFDDQIVVASSYATKWYITLFSNSIPFETQLRVWDAWLLDGQDVISMVALGIIWAHRSVILDPSADFETILSALSSFFVPEDDDALMLWVKDALSRKDVKGSLRNARNEYRRKVENGEAAALML